MDECQACDFGFFSSGEFLIQSNVVFSFTIAAGGLSTLFLNLILGYKCDKTFFHFNRKEKKDLKKIKFCLFEVAKLSLTCDLLKTGYLHVKRPF